MPFQFNDDYAFATAASENNEGQTGMKLRDYFAGQALAGLAANEKHMAGISQPTVDQIVSTLAQHAYTVADAMLKEREK
jgi:hypothetical protein|tara:strand:- start:738 stop:974 length:237 start_codon:yes stop_codon:yes gene_type:complete